MPSAAMPSIRHAITTMVLLAHLWSCASEPLPSEAATPPVTVFATLYWGAVQSCTTCAPLVAWAETRTHDLPHGAGLLLRDWMQSGAISAVTTAIPMGHDQGFAGFQLNLAASQATPNLEQAGLTCTLDADATRCEFSPDKPPLLLVNSTDKTSALLASSLPANSITPAAQYAFELPANPNLLARAHLQTLPFTELMRDPPEGWLNLSILANALRWTAEAEIRLFHADDTFTLELEALTDSPASAEKTTELLDGLSSFAQAAWNWSDPDTADAWAAVFESAEFEANGPSAHGVWRIPAALIEALPVGPAGRAASE